MRHLMQAQRTPVLSDQHGVTTHSGTQPAVLTQHCQNQDMLQKKSCSVLCCQTPGAAFTGGISSVSCQSCQKPRNPNHQGSQHLLAH